MNIETYRAKQQKLLEGTQQYRHICPHCLLPSVICYCAQIKIIDPPADFVILIHPIEVRRKIATGRMSHLCLKNSHLIMGHDFSKKEKLNEILSDTQRHCVILYPSVNSTNISKLTQNERSDLMPKNKRLTIIVIDGTWETAKKMMKHSHNINKLPRICFSPARPSNFRVRKQPHENCLSTIEAIHHTIELLGPSLGFDTTLGEHDHLLTTFNAMVDMQLEFVKRAHDRAEPSRYKSRVTNPQK